MCEATDYYQSEWKSTTYSSIYGTMDISKDFVDGDVKTTETIIKYGYLSRFRPGVAKKVIMKKEGETYVAETNPQDNWYVSNFHIATFGIFNNNQKIIFKKLVIEKNFITGTYVSVSAWYDRGTFKIFLS